MSFLTLLWWKQFVLHDLFILTGDEIEVHKDVKCIFFLWTNLHGTGCMQSHSLKYYAGKGMFTVFGRQNLLSN